MTASSNLSRDPSGHLPRPLLEDWTWQESGSCRRSAPEIFFPEDAGRSGLRAREEQAKQICRQCPVLARCRDHALAVGESHGVWGAMSARERTRVYAAGA
jgi:WhiB family transcriptional regulator, redox-sensing transcriptional regulator